MARSTSARRLGRILALLKDEMTWAWSALEVARALEQRHAPAQASGLSAFIHRAARQEAILAASRLISSDQESVTLHYLMDHVRHHPQIFRGASPGELDRLLARWDQDWLEWALKTSQDYWSSSKIRWAPSTGYITAKRLIVNCCVRRSDERRDALRRISIRETYDNLLQLESSAFE